MRNRRLTVNGSRAFSNNLLLGSQKSEGQASASKMECGLCYTEFLPTDEVFNCKKMHVFHTNCFEDRAVDDEDEGDIKGMISKCPTCNVEMTFDNGRASINSDSI